MDLFLRPFQAAFCKRLFGIQIVIRAIQGIEQKATPKKSITTLTKMAEPASAYVVPIGGEAKPVVAQVVAVGGGGGGAMDVAAFQNLANSSSLEFKQGNVFWEAVSGGCAANSYMIRDRLSTDNHGKMTPVFIMSEESSCWCRWCK